MGCTAPTSCHVLETFPSEKESSVKVLTTDDISVAVGRQDVHRHVGVGEHMEVALVVQPHRGVCQRTTVRAVHQELLLEELEAVALSPMSSVATRCKLEVGVAAYLRTW